MEQKIIAIDGYEAYFGSPVGVGRFSREILLNLYKLTKNRNDLLFRIYIPGEYKNFLPPNRQNWEYKKLFNPKLWTFIALPLALFLDRPKADVIYTPTHYIPRFINIPKIVTVMDLSYDKFPDYFKKSDLFKLKNWTDYSIKKSTKIITISNNSKSDIIKKYGQNKLKVAVVYPGFTSMNVDKNLNFEKLQEKYNITKNFILSVGTLQPRKNYPRLIEAFAKLRNELPKEFENLQLVIVGKKGWQYNETLEAPAKFGVSNYVKFLDYIDDYELGLLYSVALCTTIVSLYEGFGLPVLEAMANRSIVVVSNVSSLPEVGGDAPIYIDPLSVESIKNGLLSAVKINIKDRKNKIEKGILQTKKFTWEKSAKQVLEEILKI